MESTTAVMTQEEEEDASTKKLRENHMRQMKSVLRVILHLDIRCCICDVYLCDKLCKESVRIMKNLYACSTKCNNEFDVLNPNV